MTAGALPRSPGIVAARLAAIVGVPALLAWTVGVSMPVEAAGAGLLLATATLAAASAPAGLAILALLAPFDAYVRPMVLYRDFLVTDVVAFGFIAGAAVRWKPRAVSGDARMACALLMIFGAFCVVSLGPDNWTDALDNVARFAYFAVLVWMLAASRLDGALPIVVPAALAAATLFRFWQEAVAYFGSPDFFFHPSFQFGAFTSNPNTIGGFAACVLPFAGAASLLHPSARWRAAAAFFFALLASGIVLTFSKGAWVTAFAGLGVVAVHAIVRGWRPARGARLAAVAALAIAMLLPPVRAIPLMMFERWTSYGSELSNRERLRYIDVATALIVDRPLLGVGLERFGDAFKEQTGARVGPDDPHNAYMMVAAELGVPALGTYLLMAAAVAAAAWRRARLAPPESAAVRVGLSAAVSALLVFQLFSAEPLASRLTWIVFGLALTGDDARVRT